MVSACRRQLPAGHGNVHRVAGLCAQGGHGELEGPHVERRRLRAVERHKGSVDRNRRPIGRGTRGAASYFWFTPAAAGCGAGGTCSVIPQIVLANGTADWQVQAWTTVGYGAWSSLVNVSVSIAGASAPVLVSPDGAAGGSDPP